MKPETPINLQCRLAEVGDMMLYFNWANDPEVRKNSFDSSPILLENHQIWFLKNIHSNATLMLVFLDNNVPVGQVRFILEENQALLNYSVDAVYRGKKLAAPIIQQAVDELKKRNPFVQSVIAEVKPENTASIRPFEKNGFSLVDSSPAKIIFKYSLE